MFKSYVAPEENEEANKQLPRLMVEGLMLGGTGLGVLALIFEIAADAFSVAAYQTLLAIHGADGHHEIAIGAFIVLSTMLLLGIVPAYKAGAYLRPNAGGSGPLVEAIGPAKMRWLSWIGTSLFFLDAVLTIIISSISAADVTMLIYPQWAAYRIVLAEVFALFIMAVLVAVGPKRAVPLFLIGGGAFTIFTIGALSLVGVTATANPEWAFLADGIVGRLEVNGVVEHVVEAKEELSALGVAAFFALFFGSMSSAMLGFSGYEVIPASGKHAARPKWKVINTALTLAAVFLIGTGVFQLFAAQRWLIPATEGYSTLLIEYEIVAAQMLGNGLEPEDITITASDRRRAAELYQSREDEHHDPAVDGHGGPTEEELAYTFAFTRALNGAVEGTLGESFLFVAGSLLAIILLLAQGGGYVGGAAVAANAARLGRLPSFFEDDRIGIAVIWGVAAVLIPVIREVVIVESYYAFGFVSAFVITSTTVYFVRNDALLDKGIQPDSDEAKSLRFAGLRGMIASYAMLLILITQKTDALFAIVVAGTIITIIQLYTAHRGIQVKPELAQAPEVKAGATHLAYEAGIQRAHDQARQRGLVDLVNELVETGAFNKFNVGHQRIIKMVCHLYNLEPEMFEPHEEHHERIEEPSLELEKTYMDAYNQREKVLNDIEYYSHFGIFTFIHNYHRNWVDEEHGREGSVVQKAMLDLLFPLTDHDEIWKQYSAYKPAFLPEAIWQFSRERYRWAKDQWPNLSDRITTIWTLQDFGLIPADVDVRMVISVAGGRNYRMVKFSTKAEGERLTTTIEDMEKPADDV
ncbi:MAG TPA: hypothetical protein VLL52_23255 [Anaerolineae bacterium]|nr:hypothetical protein [Anaerolineae bacterium]